RFREILEDRPWEFMYSLRIIPIEQVVRTDLEEIQKATMKRSHRIREDEKFRVTVEKRFNETTTSEIVDAIATKIGRKVDLTNPNKIVLIEVVGGFTGVSVIDPMDILSVTREKNGVIQV
ncbi:MAG: THUMP domain-containing protein, partial [Candidatus Ranarchaeia archaeon]